MHAVSHEISGHGTGSLFSRLLKKLSPEIGAVILSLKFLTSMMYGALLFVLSISQVRLLLGKILPYIVIYCVGTYFTLLPAYLVIPLVFIPIKFTGPILLLSVVLSFFMMFSI
jgi:hypothetical protein